MATCPRCMGALTENHRCPRGRFSRVTDAFGTVAVGAVAGALVPVAFSGSDPPISLVLAAAALGAVLARALREALGPHF